MEYKIKSNFGNANSTVWDTTKDLKNIFENNDNVVLDFKDFKESNPFNMLVIAQTIKPYKTGEKISIKGKARKINDYLEHIGFYNACGFDYGKRVGEAKSNSNYVPVRILKFSEYNGFYQQIEKQAEELANVLNFDKNLTKLTKYIFIELIRNVFEHADTDKLMLCAQKWPTHNLVEIAITDDGIGIPKSMKKKRKLDDDLTCIQLAKLPGISSMSNHAVVDSQDPWSNSGYGLYVINELCKLYNGSMIIASGNYAIYDRKNSSDIREDIDFKGTAICVRFCTDIAVNFQKELNKIVEKGQSISTQFQDSIKRASKSSGGKY